jgi:4-amino-4-deoxy-L-arabinose transferase-like glycosyltransferase
VTLPLTKRLFLTNILLICIMLVMIGRFAVVGWNRILMNTNSSDGDQGAYLQLGLDLREHGVITDGKRNPLYPALLSIFAEREWRYFTWAKILNLGIGLTTILALYAVGYRLFDKVTAILAAFLLSINMEFILHSTFALAEALLVLWVLLAWYAMVRALQRPEQTRYWIIGGVLAALAYLTKGTGLLIALCFVVTATLLYGPRLWRRRTFWGFVAGFALIALPLWIYNWVAFGSPIYNSAIKNVMWMGTAEEKYIADPAELPTLWSYIQDHSLIETWNRFWRGLLDMRFFFAKVLWPTRSLAFDRFLLAGGLDVILVLLAVAMIVSRRFLFPIVKKNREMLLFTAVLFIVFYVLFGWYLAIAPFPIRFLLVLSPILLLLLSAGVVGLIKSAWESPKIPRLAKLGGSVVIFVLALWISRWFVITEVANAQSAHQNPFVADTNFNEYNEQSLVWVRSGHADTESVSVLWGPSHNLPIWRHTESLHFVRTPLATETLDQLEIFLDANNVTYVIADADMVSRRPELADDLGISLAEGERLEVKDFPSGWALGLAIPEMPCRWCVFRRISADPPIAPTDYVLGESIRLFGYDVQPDYVSPGGQLTVSLYWEMLHPVSTDYTVFTQLLGPDFQLHGQMDRQPLSGHWPTSRWLPGQRFLDKLVIDVSETAPEGEYVLLVGLYDLGTGQRLPVALNGERIPDDAIGLYRLETGEAKSGQ